MSYWTGPFSTAKPSTCDVYPQTPAPPYYMTFTKRDVKTDPRWQTYEQHYFNYLSYDPTVPSLRGNYYRYNTRIRPYKPSAQYAPTLQMVTRQQPFERLWSEIILGNDARSAKAEDHFFRAQNGTLF